MKDTAIVKYKDNKVSGEIESLLEQTVTLTGADFYKVGGKTVPSARALQWDANRKHISTRIVSWGKDDERAFAIVAGWVGNEDNPVQYKEAIVEIDFSVLQAYYVIEKAKDRWKITRDETTGKPSFKDEQHKAEMYTYMLRKKQFAIRECVTKAEAIVNRKLLSMEFREEEEIESEKAEIKVISQQNKPQSYGTYNKHGTVDKEQPKEAVIDNTNVKGGINFMKLIIEGLKTEKDKRDFLIKASNDKEASIHENLIKKLSGRNVLDLEEKQMDGLLMMLKLESKVK